jgi:signal transduction histidine kinase
MWASPSSAFLLYDYCVERRQRKVMNTAVESKLNVVLLDEMVQERTQRLKDSNMKLEDANRMVMMASAAQLEHFASMSHEIRTPLNCIIGISSLLQDTELDPQQKEEVRMIVTSGELLRTVVDDVLDYSKLESGNFEIDIKRSNLQETLNTIVHSIDIKDQAKKLLVRPFYGVTLGEFIDTDSRRLQQILYNLLGNAIKFSKEGGIVELHVCLCSSDGDREAPDNKSFKVVKAGDPVLQFVIKDYGKGIAKDHFEKIFEPFNQASAETSSVYGGTGLGLAITS